MCPFSPQVIPFIGKEYSFVLHLIPSFTSFHALFFATTRRVVCLFCACWLSWWWQPCPSVEEWAPLRKSTGWWCPLCYCLWPSASTGPFSCRMRLRELCTSSLQTGVCVRESTKHGGTAVLWWQWFVAVLSVQVNLRPVLMQCMWFQMW